MSNENFAEIERNIIGEIWQNSEINENMLYMADRLGSRFAGTTSEAKAQQYMVNKFREYGFKNAYKDEFQYYGWERGSVELEMLSPIQRKLDAISLAVSPEGSIKGEVVNVGTGSPDEFRKLGKEEIKGKIVFCSSATSPNGERIHRRTKYGYAVDYGAKAFIFMNHNPGQLAPTGSLRPAYKMGGEIPGIGVSRETGKLMVRLANERDPFTVRIRNESRIIPESTSANIVAELEGTSKQDTWIVVGGHFDGHDISQGAMDNLSGVAVTMELARVFRKYKDHLKRGIRFVCFAAEEIGVTGSTCYVAKHKNEIGNIAMMLNLELGGLADENGTQHAAFTVMQPEELKNTLKTITEDIQYPTTISDRLVTASDHWPFFMEGIPTIMGSSEPSQRRLIEGRGWGHTSADMMDKVDPRNLQEGAMVFARALFRLANMEEKIADQTSKEKIIKRLKEEDIKETLEIQKKWHPHSIK